MAGTGLVYHGVAANDRSWQELTLFTIALLLSRIILDLAALCGAVCNLLFAVNCCFVQHDSNAVEAKKPIVQTLFTVNFHFQHDSNGFEAIKMIVQTLFSISG